MLKHKINWLEFNLDKKRIMCILRKDKEKTQMKLITINTAQRRTACMSCYGIAWHFMAWHGTA